MYVFLYDLSRVKSETHLDAVEIAHKRASVIPNMYLKGLVLTIMKKMSGKIRKKWIRRPTTTVAV